MRTALVVLRLLCASAAGVLVLACNGRFAERPLQPAPSAKTHSTTIHRPAKLTSVATERTDARGEPLRVSCVSCHSQLEPSPQLPVSTAQLREFHRHLAFDHGTTTCASCHVLGDQSELRLASGERLPMTEAIELCGQCHGPQYRDYRRGSHGGMTGHWDLSRGPRERNNCVDCHDPHVPAYPPVMPVHPPFDRPAAREGERGSSGAPEAAVAPTVGEEG